MLKIHVKLALYVSFEDRKLYFQTCKDWTVSTSKWMSESKISAHWSSYKQNWNHTLVYSASNLRVESNTSEIMKTTRTKL